MSLSSGPVTEEEWFELWLEGLGQEFKSITFGIRKDPTSDMYVEFIYTDDKNEVHKIDRVYKPDIKQYMITFYEGVEFARSHKSQLK